jgi:hypothetical protein
MRRSLSSFGTLPMEWVPSRWGVESGALDGRCPDEPLRLSGQDWSGHAECVSWSDTDQVLRQTRCDMPCIAAQGLSLGPEMHGCGVEWWRANREAAPVNGQPELKTPVCKKAGHLAMSPACRLLEAQLPWRSTKRCVTSARSLTWRASKSTGFLDSHACELQLVPRVIF